MPASPLDATQIRVAGSGALWVAPVGSTGPTDSTTALDAAFKNLGFTNTSGFVYTPSLKTNSVEGWQSVQALRNYATSKTAKLAFTLQQVNAAILALAWNGTVTPSAGGVYGISIPDDAEIPEQAIVADWVDGAINQRLYFPRASLITPPTQKFSRTAELNFPFEFQPLVPATGNSIQIFGVDPNVGGA